MRGALLATLLLGQLLGAGPATAQNEGKFACTMSVGNSLNFGDYVPSRGLPTTASTTAELFCTHLGGGSVLVSWAAELSNGATGDCRLRAMKTGSASQALSYNVYIDNPVGGIWGNRGCESFPSGTIRLSNGQSASSGARRLYGEIPAGQLISPGRYADTLLLTVSY
ncbi:spore coat protein U domain-containing protein [Roseateles violae]|uniref:Spore coat protein U domain-containing protein n=1 Tax=Roseateles violae TaxID=3058042 RepID=A0ABT8DRZ9_9BURK|nr:spore coat protein U domain-containing protein [Pelomonas sp. PFR6]MDN3919699.1 spore coat protein U domain-containing protein [Pelomonas sp. PFR6]